MDQDFNNNVYSINLSHVKTPAEIIYDLSIILDSEEARNKRVCLKLGNIELNQSQILSIKSLINSINSTLSYIDTNSALTESSALALGIVIANSSGERIIAEEPEMTYKTVEEITQTTEENIEQFEQSAPQETATPEEYQIPWEEITMEDEIQIPSTPREYEKLEDHTADEQEEEEKKPETEEIKTHLGEITLNIPSSEEIKEELNTIFNSEKKLEDIFEIPTESENETTITDAISISEKEYTDEDFALDSYPTKYIKQTIRSGQVINYEGNIVIIGDCHPGSEIISSGDITVWGVLSGIAHAGSAGNEKAKIRALKMNALQLRIANCYARRPDSLSTIFVEKTNTFIPEEARIVNGEIVIFKIND